MRVNKNGVIIISDDLIISPGFSFEQFKHSKFYKNQDGVKIIHLDEKQIMDNRRYYVSLLFRKGKIYMVSLMCDDKDFSEIDEYKRKIFHDEILMEWGIKGQEEYSWGGISSNYDPKGNVSNINITYL